MKSKLEQKADDRVRLLYKAVAVLAVALVIVCIASYSAGKSSGRQDVIDIMMKTPPIDLSYQYFGNATGLPSSDGNYFYSVVGGTTDQHIALGFGSYQYGNGTLTLLGGGELRTGVLVIYEHLLATFDYDKSMGHINEIMSIELTGLPKSFMFNTSIVDSTRSEG